MEERVENIEGTVELISDSDVTLPREEYNALIEAKVRIDILKQYFMTGKYVGDEDVRLIIGMEATEANG